jgi:hypothetical protein
MVDKARRTSKQATLDVIAQVFNVAAAKMKNAKGHRFLRVNTMHIILQRRKMWPVFSACTSEIFGFR